MLKLLRIQNLILIDSAEIHFSEGFNVLSGETGSGKSAILSAMGLLAGERADSGLIRRGSDKSVVEAAFDIDLKPAILKILENAGIDHDSESELLIRREIASNGKNRCFVNQQLVQIKILRELSESLLEIVGQHANQVLLSIEKHAQILDLFGEIEAEAVSFQKSWQQENQLRKQLEALVNQEAQRLREIEVCRMEIEELDEAQLKEGEDESLFEEYTLLTNAEERSEKVTAILEAISDGRHSALQLLSKHKNTFEDLVRIDAHFADLAQVYDTALIELQEVAYSMRAALSHIEHQPEKAAAINERLTLISRLKRKYGHSIAEVFTYYSRTKTKLEELESADVRIEELRIELDRIKLSNNTLGKELTKKRNRAAQDLEKSLTEQLHLLNMPKAEFHIEIRDQKRNDRGDDRVEFYFSPNAGEHRISIKECASGGELSRLLLGLQTLLANKSLISTLVFDEIDSNIGGATARIVGKKLNEIGKHHQVVCITHFPQVAQEAQHHIQISKQEKNGRTVSQVSVLKTSERKKEIARMSGNTDATA